MQANDHLQEAACHLDSAIQSLRLAMQRMPQIAAMVIEPIVSVLGPLAVRVRQVVQANQE